MPRDPAVGPNDLEIEDAAEGEAGDTTVLGVVPGVRELTGDRIGHPASLVSYDAPRSDVTEVALATRRM